MSEFWYRGEGVSVTPAKAGTVLNDIGDGMYLTDKIEVAKQYANERAASVDDRRVYKVSISGTNMRVLDLTTDARWKKHISTPLPGGTIESQLQAGTASQYSQHFENFLRANKIDLNQYDAVIGYEYRNGGRQMCILYKNGQPSTVQTKLRTLFVPVGGSPIPKSPPGTLRFNGRIGTGLKFAGGTLATAVVAFLLGKVIEKQNEESIKRQYEALLPAVERAIRAKNIEALKLIADKKPAFAVVRVSHDVTHMHMGPYAGWSPSAPSVVFDGVEIKDKEENGADGHERDNFLTPGSMLERHFYKTSFKLTFSQEEIDLYVAFQKELFWYDARLIYNVLPESQLSPADYERLRRERNDLMEKFYEAMGTPWYVRKDYI